MTTRFRSVVLDVDSTLCGIEGVDWLAKRRGPDVARRIEALTDRAMNGELALDAVYGARLDVVRPTRADVAALADAYRHELAPGAADAVAAFQRAGMRVVLVSGGLRQAIEPLATALGTELQAVDIVFSAGGDYAGFDSASPLTTQSGKRDVVAGLGLPRPAAAVGDGATDLAMKERVDRFVAFTGFVSRAHVVAEADDVAASFDEVVRLLGPGTAR